MRWKDHAACRGSDVDFFPTMGYDRRPESLAEYEAKVAEAVALCAACPVKEECGEFARREPEGIWAGVLHEPRQQKNNRKKAAADRERRLKERQSA